MASMMAKELGFELALEQWSEAALEMLIDLGAVNESLALHSVRISKEAW